jgi:hypothetical protein
MLVMPDGAFAVADVLQGVRSVPRGSSKVY